MTPALNDKQLHRMAFRIALFQRRGMPERDAERLADRLADRDHDRDDRRMCIECAGLQRGGTCFPASQGWVANTSRHHQPVPTLLQRCEHFDFAKPA